MHVSSLTKSHDEILNESAHQIYLQQFFESID